jgi:hypothetical protein
MADALGIYRIELEFDHGTAMWGGNYSSADEAQAQVSRAREEHPDATGARVVELIGSDSGKTAKWEQVS